MNIIIIAVGALVVASLVVMLTIDALEEQKCAEIRETELQKLQSRFEAKEKKNVIFLNLGEEM
jgi:hypothetical protein